MRLPKHLEFVEYEGDMISGTGPYTVHLKDSRTNRIYHIKIPAPAKGDNSVKYFMDEFAKQLKEQLDEDLER